MDALSQTNSDGASGGMANVGAARHSNRRNRARRAITKPAFVAVLGALGLVALYLGLITLAQGWDHALRQLSEDRYYIVPIVAGFGLQLGLFTHLRTMGQHASAGGVTTSTGTSTAAMLACCAHHLGDLVPLVGLSGAALFLNAYKTPLLWLGITMNVIGIGYLVYQIERQRQHKPRRWIAYSDKQ